MANLIREFRTIKYEYFRKDFLSQVWIRMSKLTDSCVWQVTKFTSCFVNRFSSLNIGFGVVALRWMIIIDLIRNVYLSLLVWQAKADSDRIAIRSRSNKTTEEKQLLPHLSTLSFCALLLMFMQTQATERQSTVTRFRLLYPRKPPKSHGDYVVVPNPIQITFYCCPAHFICL